MRRLGKADKWGQRVVFLASGIPFEECRFRCRGGFIKFVWHALPKSAPLRTLVLCNWAR
jgi:hypothetical protein